VTTVQALLPGQDYFSDVQYDSIMDQSITLDDTVMNIGIGAKGKDISCIIQEPTRLYKNPNLDLATASLLKMPCLFYILESRYWAYEFCPFKHVLQFHPTANNKDYLYFLGIYTKHISTSIEQGIVDGVEEYHLVQIFKDGTKCDLNGQPRQSRIEYYCSNQEKVKKF
jgi:hypothetical protein